MSEDEAKKWVKDKANQQSVVDRFFSDTTWSREKWAIFMAGIPGAGKTEFVKNALEIWDDRLVSIEHDALVEYIEGYKPVDYYNYRKAGSVLVTRIYEECLTRGYGFILDGTLSHEHGYRNVEKALKQHYFVQVIYIVQDAKFAWQITKDRKVLNQRAIEKAGFISTCNKINTNLMQLFRRFKLHPGFSMWIFNKNIRSVGDGNEARATIYAAAIGDIKPQVGDSAEIEKALAATYNVEELE